MRNLSEEARAETPRPRRRPVSPYIQPKTGIHYTNAAQATLTECAVSAGTWGLPIVSFDAMRQAFFRDAGARYGDFVYLSQPADWRFQLPTATAGARYIYFNFNVHAGPAVLEVPAGGAAELSGSLLDAWQVPVMDVGRTGEDHGHGGSYLLLPPNYNGAVPDRYIPVRLPTVNGYAALRLSVADESASALRGAFAHAKQLHLYPMAQAAQPPASRFIDMTGRLFDGVMRFDLRYFDALAHVLDEEPALIRDADVLHDLKTLGMASYERFAPDPYLETMLADAAAQIRDQLRRALRRVNTPYWSDRQWFAPATGPGPQAGFVSVDGELNVEARALYYLLSAAPPARAALAPCQLLTFTDAQRHALAGGVSYRLRVPPSIPADHGWTATAYGALTATFIHEAPSLAIGSTGAAVQRNADDSIDIYFGPRPPEGLEHNWIATGTGDPWFLSFRLHGPRKPVVDKSWKLPDLEPLP
jgi:hypothetical protein